MARRRGMNVFGLAFLDAMTCGLGAVVLLYMVINASVGIRADRVTTDLTSEVERLESEVFGGNERVVALRNSLRKIDERHVLARDLSRRLIEAFDELAVKLAAYEEENQTRTASLEDLKTRLQSLEQDARSLADEMPETEAAGESVRAFVGDGDRQYLTGLKLGGKRTLILIDTSASMLDETIVNIVVRRNLPDERKIRAEKWRRAVSTVDWLTTQFPGDSHFQVYAFSEQAGPLLPDTAGEWLDAGDRAVLDEAVGTLRATVPDGGTNLYRAFGAVKALRPAPDNLILITDGLPTQGASPPRRGTISGKERLKLFDRARGRLPSNLPVNVILFPMEGDPMAASAFWKLALATRGSFISPAKDWP